MSDVAREDLEWLVDRRSKIQQLLLDIYSLEAPESATSRQMAFQLLVAIGFSLWRAAFLAEGEHGSERIQEHAQKFLMKLIADNAIGYSQDRESLSWTFGYYVNNAYLRLARFQKQIGLSKTHVEIVAQFLDSQVMNFETAPEPHTAWDNAYEATKDALRKALAIK